MWGLVLSNTGLSLIEDGTQRAAHGPLVQPAAAMTLTPERLSDETTSKSRCLTELEAVRRPVPADPPHALPPLTMGHLHSGAGRVGWYRVWTMQDKRPPSPPCRATGVVSHHWLLHMPSFSLVPIKPILAPKITARHPVEFCPPPAQPLGLTSLDHEKHTATLPGPCGMSWTILTTLKMTCRRMQSQAAVE